MPNDAARRLRRAADRDSAAGVEPLDLHSAAARISDGQARRVERQLVLPHLDVAGEHRAVGAILHLEPVGGEVDRARRCYGP